MPKSSTRFTSDGCGNSGCPYRRLKHSTPAPQRVYCQGTSLPGMAAEWYIRPNVPWKDIYTRQCRTKAGRIIKDLSHPNNGLFELTQSGKCFRIEICAPYIYSIFNILLIMSSSVPEGATKHSIA